MELVKVPVLRFAPLWKQIGNDLQDRFNIVIAGGYASYCLSEIPAPLHMIDDVDWFCLAKGSEAHIVQYNLGTDPLTAHLKTKYDWNAFSSAVHTYKEHLNVHTYHNIVMYHKFDKHDPKFSGALKKFPLKSQFILTPFFKKEALLEDFDLTVAQAIVTFEDGKLCGYASKEWIRDENFKNIRPTDSFEGQEFHNGRSLATRVLKYYNKGYSLLENDAILLASYLKTELDRSVFLDEVISRNLCKQPNTLETVRGMLKI